jgi:hypothetical protein
MAVSLVCVVGQPVLVPEQNPQRQRNLPMLIALRARRKAAGITQNVAPFFDEVIEAVKRVIWRREGGFRHDAPPGLRRERYRLSVTDGSRKTVR